MTDLTPIQCLLCVISASLVTWLITSYRYYDKLRNLRDEMRNLYASYAKLSADYIELNAKLAILTSKLSETKRNMTQEAS